MDSSLQDPILDHFLLHLGPLGDHLGPTFDQFGQILKRFALKRQYFRGHPGHYNSFQARPQKWHNSVLFFTPRAKDFWRRSTKSILTGASRLKTNMAALHIFLTLRLKGLPRQSRKSTAMNPKRMAPRSHTAKQITKRTDIHPSLVDPGPAACAE